MTATSTGGTASAEGIPYPTMPTARPPNNTHTLFGPQSPANGNTNVAPTIRVTSVTAPTPVALRRVSHGHTVGPTSAAITGAANSPMIVGAKRNGETNKPAAANLLRRVVECCGMHESLLIVVGARIRQIPQPAPLCRRRMGSTQRKRGTGACSRIGMSAAGCRGTS